MMKYDYLIVGAGLAGALYTYDLTKKGKKCLVIEKNPHIGGFCYTENIHGIEVHKFGAHIFRTNSKKVWDYVNEICEFVPFVNSPIANYRGELYSLPFNMNTFYQLFGTATPNEARKAIENDVVLPQSGVCTNMEDVVLSQCGKTIYEKLIKGYSEKQWGRPCSELPTETMAHVPMRMTFDNNYYDVAYQGIPVCGYTKFIEKMLECCDLELRTDFTNNMKHWKSIANHIIYTGRIDEYYHYRYGTLEYRSVRFEHKWLSDTDNYQGVAVMNFTDVEPKYTRCIEHKHFLKSQSNVRGTMISFEYPSLSDKDVAPIYPVRDKRNLALYERYRQLASTEPNVTFFGQLADYRSYNMSHLIEKFI